MKKLNQIKKENFSAVKDLYDHIVADNIKLHDMVYPEVFGPSQYTGQFSDNSVDELRLMGRLMNLPSESEILDIGCGRGLVADFMTREFSWKITGIDLSELSVKYADSNIKKSGNSKPEFINANIYDYDFSSRFNGIYLTGALCHFDSYKLFQLCRKLLKPGGKLAFMERIRLKNIETKIWSELTDNWKCPYVYSCKEYHSLLQNCGFTICHNLDLTDKFKIWQAGSVSVRKRLKDDIIRLSSIQYYNISLDLAEYENRATQQGKLGYVCIIAES